MFRTFGSRLSVVAERIEQGSRGSSPATAVPSPKKLETSQPQIVLASIGEYLATSQTQSGQISNKVYATVRTVLPDGVENIGIACPDTSWVESCCRDSHTLWITFRLADQRSV